MLVDYHNHVIAHGEYDYSLNWLQEYLERAKAVGVDEIGFLEHDEFVDKISLEVLRQAEINNPEINIRLGLEIDYIPGREAEIRQLSTCLPFDYVMGSVHFIDGWGFDHPDYRHLYDNKELFEVYKSYYELVAQATNSERFDILGHLDLIKVWGHKLSKKKNYELLEPLFKAIKVSDTVVEINSGGLRKPVAELYPAEDLLPIMYGLDIPICLGSDAHHPEQTGLFISEACQAAKKAGYRYITGFKRRNRYFHPI